jgi:hypothetical protein
MLRIAKISCTILSLLGVTSLIGSIVNGSFSAQSWFMASYFISALVAINVFEHMFKRGA